MKARNQAQLRASRTQRQEDWNEYKRLRNQVNNRLKFEKSNYSRKKLKECNSNPKETWQCVKSLLAWSSGGPPTQLVSNGSLLTKPSDLSETMNSYFINKVKKLRQQLPESPGDPSELVKKLMTGVNCTFSFRPVLPDEVNSIIKNMRSSKSCGIDEIDSCVIKMGNEQLLPAITHVINLSIRSGHFPQHWKCAKIIPLHKKEDKTDPKNYRPVALLPVISKILERAVFMQFVKYLEENNIMNPKHHGFRGSHSTCTALLEMYDIWTEAQAEGKVSATIMLDLSAAFDVVDFGILIQKMEIHGFDSNSIKWISNYLSCRSQKVLIDGHLSSSKPVMVGVPQGSILAPLLYLVYTNDLTEAVHDHCDPPSIQQQGELNFRSGCKICGSICLYADDSTYTISQNDPVLLKATMDAKYQNITQYMAKNKLILNTNKTHLLVMASKRQHKIHGDFGISLNTGNEIIQPTCNEKLLGAIISNDMEWSMHIRDHKESLQRNLSTRLNALTKVCMIADFATRKLVANGIFMSSLINLIQLWSGTTDTLLDMLQVTQNRAARLVTKLPPTTSCETLLRQVGWLSVRQLSVYHSMIMVFNIRRTGRPYHFSKSFHSTFSRQTRYSNGNYINIQGRIPNNLRRDNFTYRAAVGWNCLPGDIRSADSVYSFKRKLKIWVKNNISI